MRSPLLISILSLLASAPRLPAASLKAVLAKMDGSAASFRSLTASVRRLQHTEVIQDDSEEFGAICVRRNGTQVLRMLLNLTRPDAKAVAFHDRKVEIYYPKIKTVQEYDFGRQGALVDQFLLLGFGTSGKELEKSYGLKVLGEEVVSGQKTTRLELTPKSAKVREHFIRFELWIGDAGYPLQQKLHQTGGDYHLVTYSDVKWNAAVSDDALRLNLPPGVVREYPQK